MVWLGEFNVLVMLACGMGLEHKVEGRKLWLGCATFGSDPVGRSLEKSGENCPAC